MKGRGEEREGERRGKGRGEGGARFCNCFGGNNWPIYMALCSFLVWGGLLDTGSMPN